MEEKAFLDTHVILWLYSGDLERFPKSLLVRMEKMILAASPLALLEIDYLHEIGRINVASNTLYKELDQKIDLIIEDCSLQALSVEAKKHSWTRDPFDRLLVSQAKISHSFFITKDDTIRKNYSKSLWA